VSDVLSKASGEGVAAIADATVRARAVSNYNTHTEIDGDITAGGAAAINAKTNVIADTQARVDADGLGGDGDGNDTGGWGSRVAQSSGSDTKVTIGMTADIIADSISVFADTNVSATAYGESDSDALGADADARADALVGKSNSRRPRRPRSPPTSASSTYSPTPTATAAVAAATPTPPRTRSATRSPR
jgi:hypothetical protein